jgi:hypothetical protein
MAAVALLALSSVGCIRLPWQRWSNWKAVRSKHITLYTSTKVHYRHTVDTFEIAHAAVASLPLFRGHDVAPVEVLFLEEPDFVASLGRLRAGVTIAQVPGEGRLGAKSLIVVFEDTEVGGAAHYLMHLLVHDKLPKAPLWMHEAFATYFQGVRYAKDGNGVISCYGYLSGGGQLVPLADLFGLRWEEYDSSGQSGWHKHSASMLLDYLYSAEDGKLRATIPIVIGRTAIGGSATQAFGAALPGVSVEELDRRMRDFHKQSEAHPRPQCPLSVSVPPELQADLGERQIEDVSEEDIRTLVRRVRMVPHRSGRIDWYPPDAVVLAPLPEAKPPEAKPTPPEATP